jgi:Dipeptide/tripeptide permease
MAINIGALFAPTAAVKIHDWGITSLHMDPNAAYHLAFAVACVSLILSIAIYYTFRPGFKHLEGNTKKKDEKSGAASEAEELSPAETKERIIALCLVFAVVIFFWMAFHQNGLTLTYFADEFVQPTAEGAQSMVFDVINLFMVIVIVYAGFAFFGAKTGKAKGISALVMLAALAVIVYKYSVVEGSVSVSAPIFQQFNPFYVVALTPVSMAIFGALARKGKEPTAPRKIAYGMLIAGCGFLVMLLASMGLNSPDAQKAAAEGAKTFASPNWLIGTYLVLTFGELLLSPMGISFVSKVAPPKYKGAMMGGWFVATALGNLLVSVGGFLWGDLPLTVVWSVFIVLCILSAIFMFAVMGKLEKVAK